MQPETIVEEIGVVATMARLLEVEVIQMQPPYHGRRKPRSSPYDGELYWTADVVRSFEALRQTLFDTRVLLSILESERTGPVGVTGLSLGGSLSALLRDAPVLRAMREDLARYGWTHEDFGAFFGRAWSLGPRTPARLRERRN